MLSSRRSQKGPAEKFSRTIVYDSHRPREQARYLQNALTRFERDRWLLNQLGTKEALGILYGQLMGRGLFRDRLSYKRIFDCPAHFWVRFYQEIRHRVDELERNRSLTPSDRDALERLKKFSLANVRLVSMDQTPTWLEEFRRLAGENP